MTWSIFSFGVFARFAFFLSRDVYLYRFNGCRPMFSVQNAQGDAVLTINGPICRCQTICCTEDIAFPVVFLKYYIYHITETERSQKKFRLNG